MSNPTAVAYDEVPYPGVPFRQTHPDRLATLAALFGMAPAPVERCRVLELGCGDGGNLIPMALTLPDSTFVGLDLSGRAVAKGQEVAAALGLDNLTLLTCDVRDVTPDWGAFDYVIAHGLFSWVPPEVGEKVLAVCRDNLAPQGVAYVSYNALPGRHLSHMVREMLLYRTRASTAGTRFEDARALARFLVETQAAAPPETALFRKELERLLSFPDHILCHDDLAAFNRPLYFHEFMERAAGHGLQFLAEADYFEMQDHIYPSEITRHLRELAGEDVLAREQYLDFLKLRRFRQTLLCHAGVALERPPAAARVAEMCVASPARPTSPAPDLRSETEEVFRGPRGAAMRTNMPLAKAAVVCLAAAWPRWLPFGEVAWQARAALERAAEGTPTEPDADFLAGFLLQAYAAGLVELHKDEPHFVTEVGLRPEISPLARLQVTRGESHVTSLRHESVPIEHPLSRILLGLLDGTRDRGALTEELTNAIVTGKVALEVEGRSITDPTRVRALVSASLDGNLAKLARGALLVR